MVTLKPSCTELWVSLESCGDHKIKMVSRCCEYGLLMKPPLKQLGIFLFRTNYSLELVIIKFRKRKEKRKEL